MFYKIILIHSSFTLLRRERELLRRSPFHSGSNPRFLIHSSFTLLRRERDLLRRSPFHFGSNPRFLIHSSFTLLRRERDSNPRYTFGVYTLSRRAPSTTRTPLLSLQRAAKLQQFLFENSNQL